jgi:EF hand
MKAKFILFASALLLVSSIAGAQEQKTPSASTQEQQAPTAKMTGEDMMGHMGQRMMGRGMMRKGMMHGMHMRLILILMDADGDGALSLEEFQEAHARIFKGIDADKDGKVTRTEMQTFFSGGPPTPDREFDDDEDDD